MLYKRVNNKNLPFRANCVYTLPGKTKTTYTQHIMKSINHSAFDRTGCSQLSQKVIQGSYFPIFGRKFFYQYSSRKTLIFSGFYLSHCYTIAWDRLSNQFFVCVCVYVCMYVCVCVCLWARLRSHFSTILHEIW